MYNINKIIFIFISIAFSLYGKVHSAESSDIDFRLIDQHGISQSLSGQTDKESALIISYQNTCFRQDYLKRIETVKKKLNINNPAIFFLNPNQSDTRESIINKAIPYPVLMDRNELISPSFQFINAFDYVAINIKTLKIISRGNIFENSKNCSLSYRPVKVISFTNNVLPSLKKACMNCHINLGNIELFKDINSIRSWAPMMIKTIRLGKMPGTPDFENIPLKEEIKTQDMKAIIGWLQAGSPIEKSEENIFSDYQNEIKSNEDKKLKNLGQPDVVLEASTEEVITPNQADFVKVYKFPKPPIKENTFLKDVFLSTNLNIAHHHQLTGNKENLSDEEALNGFSYRYTGRIPVETTLKGKKSIGFLYDYRSMLGVLRNKGFVWSGTETHMPVIDKDSYFYLTIHYTASGKKETNKPKINLYFEKENKEINPLKKMLFIPARKSFKILPNEKNYNVKITYSLKEPIKVIKYIMHAHYRAISGKISIKRPGDLNFSVLFSLPYYQFKMPSEATLLAPLVLPAGTIIISEMVYDNSRENAANPDHSITVNSGLDSITQEMSYSQIIYVDENEKNSTAF